MNQFLSAILTLLLVYGYPVVVIAVAAGSLGLPVPVTSILLAAGSFSADGSLNVITLIILITITAVIGDVFAYYVGQRIDVRTLEKHGHKFGLTRPILRGVDVFFRKWGTAGIFFSRWLVTPLGVPMNVLAGMKRYSMKKFMICSLVGECMWASIYVSLGFMFGANWQAILSYINNAPGVLALITLAGIFLFLIWNRKRFVRR
ncbi:MAG: DedA family protein [Candidatus Woesebacteria bacterium]